MKRIKILAGVGIYFFGGMAFGGAISGGGGKSVVCRDVNGTILSAEILDLYEGKAQYGYKINDSSDSLDVQIEGAINRISKGRDDANNNFNSTLKSFSAFVKSSMHLLPDGTGLQPIDDSYEVIVPKECKVEQLANFLDDKQMILVDGSIWNKLSITNQTALIVHEALYKFLRMFGEASSVRARQSVAFAFAGNSTEYFGSNLPTTVWNCYSSAAGIFWAYNDANGELVFQFNYFEGKPILSRATSVIDKVPLTETSRLLGNTYWTTMDSVYGYSAITVQFSTPDNNANYITGKIGFGAMPSHPTTDFRCRP